mmetsp:Transcript_160532/g.515303  ORF Transcript_160532/g.515303 Transcript_160532/m.515303 type:complete len:210 (-) Transcript_160532:391-1020(-)
MARCNRRRGWCSSVLDLVLGACMAAAAALRHRQTRQRVGSSDTSGIGWQALENVRCVRGQLRASLGPRGRQGHTALRAPHAADGLQPLPHACTGGELSFHIKLRTIGCSVRLGRGDIALGDWRTGRILVLVGLEAAREAASRAPASRALRACRRHCAARPAAALRGLGRPRRAVRSSIHAGAGSVKAVRARSNLPRGDAPCALGGPAVR